MKSKNYSENIIKVFKKDGFVLSEPDVLLDSDYIIERSGENFRKIMLTFEDDTGKSMCLRPDLTVASCIKYLKDNSKANSKIYYSGQAYRRSKSLNKLINYTDHVLMYNSIGYQYFIIVDRIFLSIHLLLALHLCYIFLMHEAKNHILRLSNLVVEIHENRSLEATEKALDIKKLSRSLEVQLL